ncbi:MAG: signal peptidase, partial [Aeromicrobium sp.]|nr:signal peptidase [Aeromicrobium sp.]
TASTEIYTVTKAERVIFTIPKAGYVVNAATSPAGVFVLGLYVAVVLVTVFRRGTPTEPKDPKEPPARSGGSRRADRSSRRRRSSRAASRSVAVAVVGGTLMVGTPAVATAWTDDVPVAGGVDTAFIVPASVASCGLLGLGSVRVNWTAVTGATAYVLHYGAGGGTSETVAASVTTKQFTGATSGTFTVQAQINYGSTTWTSVASNSKTYSIALGLLGVCT